MAWIENGTVRENILFSETWDDTRYRAVLHQCDLLRDLSMLENGDLTQIGERGTIIAGKQGDLSILFFPKKNKPTAIFFY
jgi:ABC-type multidrug transport system fused ATPase/permease subunit